MAKKKTAKKAHKKPQAIEAPHEPKKSKQPQKTPLGMVIAIVAVLAILIFLVLKFGLQPAEEKGSVLATVNGVPVYQAEVDEAYNRLPASYKQMVDKEVILNQTIARELLVQEAKTQGYTADNDEIDGIINEILQANQMTEADLEEQLRTNNYTLDKLKDEYVKQVLIGKLVNESVYANIQVSSVEVRQYYDDNSILFDQMRASHILVNNTDTAEELLNMLQQGADFATLARVYSLDQGSAANGGDLNYFSHNMMVEPFADAAFELEVGELSGPVQTQFGYHIIKATSKRQISFEEARDNIAQSLWSERQPEAVQTFIDGLWEKAEVVIN